MMLDPAATATCVLCADRAVVGINGAGYCAGHLDDGFTFAFRAVTIIRGMAAADAERLEQRAADLLGDVRGQLLDDDEADR